MSDSVNIVRNANNTMTRNSRVRILRALGSPKLKKATKNTILKWVTNPVPDPVVNGSVIETALTLANAAVSIW